VALTGSASLTALLGKDPDTGGPSVVYDHTSIESLPVSAFPLINMRECIVDPIVELPTVTADLEIYDIAIWVKSESARTITDIFEVMDPLLHRQWLPVSSPLHHYLYQTLRISGGCMSIWHSDIQARQGFARYALRHGRG
jgi:hypothetical protein